MTYKLSTQLSPNYTAGRGGNKILYIVIHHWDDPAKKPLMEGAISTLCNPRRGTSAHYVVEAGRVVKLVDESNTAWHAGNFKINQQSIGIECNPRASEEDKKTIGELINNIQSRHGQLKIIGHKDVVSTGCPGYYYPPATVLAPYIKKGASSAPASKPSTTTKPSSTPSASIDQLARDVIAGKYGNGDARKKALGSKYNEVQARVNELLKSGTSSKPATSSKKSNEQIAREVIQGKWGNGEDRRKRLTAAGYNYATVQSIVNKLLK